MSGRRSPWASLGAALCAFGLSLGALGHAPAYAQPSEAIPAPVAPAEAPSPTPTLAPTEAVAEPLHGQLRVGDLATLTFYLLGPGARPLAGKAPTLEIEGGRILGIEEVSPGVYRAILRPEAESLRVTTPGAGGRGLLLEAQVLPEVLPQIGLAFQGERLRLGKDEGIDFLVDAALPGLPLPAIADLSVRVNVGSAEIVEDLGEGRFRGRYTPPTRRLPQVAIVGISIGGGDTFRWGAATLPLIGHTTLQTQTAPGAKVYAWVGDARFGPFTAGPSGQVTVPVEVPPGVGGVDLVSEGQGGKSATTSPLGLPPYQRTLLLVGRPPPPRSAATLGGLEEIARDLVLLGVDIAGAPLTLSPEDLRVSAGALQETQTPRQGALQGIFTFPGQAAPVRLNLDLDGGAEVLELSAPAGRPERIGLSVNPRSLRVDDPPAQLEVQLFDGAGLPARGGQLRLESTEGKVSAPKILGPGELVAAFEPPGALPNGESAGSTVVTLKAKLFWDPGTLEPAIVDVAASRKLVDPATAQGGVPIFVRVLDREGLPVPGLALNGAVLSGGGVLTGGETGPGGWASLLYVSPGAGGVGPVRMRILVEGSPRLYRDLLLILSPGAGEDLGGRGDIPVPGAPDLVAEATVRVEAGRVRQVRVSVEPNTLFVGGVSNGEVRVRLLDVQGNAVVDPEMQITAEEGRVGPISLEPDGTHTARYVPPQGAQPGRVEVQVRGQSEPYFGATEVRLAPRQSRLLLSSRGGVISNLSPDGFTIPIGLVSVLGQLPGSDLPLYGLAGISFHRIARTFEDDAYLRSIQTNVFGTYVGGAYRIRLGPLTAQGSLALVGGLIPYATDYKVDTEGDLWQLETSLGFRTGLGLELGLGPGGLAFEFAFTQLGLDADGGESGNVGGISLELGYVVPLR